MSSRCKSARCESARCDAARRVGSARVAFLVLLLVVVGVMALLHVGGSEAPSTGTVPAADERVVEPAVAVDALTSPHDARSSETSEDVEPEAPPTAESRRAARRESGSLPVTVQLRPSFERGGESTPLVGLEVEIAVARAGEELSAPAIAVGRTDATGRATLGVRESDLDELRELPGALDLVARIHERGWQRRYVAHDYLYTALPIEFVITAQRGGTIAGRVLDAEGRGAAAEVRVDVHGDGEDGSERAATTRGAEGRFLLHFEAETPADIYAVAHGIGTAALLAHPVLFTDPLQTIELHLAGPGRVTGRVRDPRGHPAPRIPLIVTHAELEHASPADARRSPRDGLGFAEVLVETDGAGRFDAGGLRAGHYGVDAAIPGRALQPLTVAPVLADGVPLELVYTRPHAVVRIHGPDGAPWTHASWDRPRSDARAAEQSDGWPEEPRVRVVPVRAHAAEQREDPRLVASSVEGHVWTFELAASGAYDVVLDGGDLGFESRRIEVGDDTDRIEVDLVARSRPLGLLALSVVNADGEPVTTPLWVRLEGRDSGLVAYEDEHVYASRTPFDGITVPAGAWRIVVEASTVAPRSSSSAGSGRGELDLNVVPSATTTASVMLGRGGRLRVATTLRGELAVDAWPESESAIETQRSRGDFSVPPQCASLWILDDRRAPRRIRFQGDSPSLRAALDGLCLLPGPPVRSEALPVGSFTLEARFADGRRVRQAVVVSEGGVTDVTIECPESAPVSK